MNVKIDTIIRTALLVLALINNALLIFGKSPLPISDEALTQVITFFFTTATALWAWWKNNSFTKDAIKADNFLASLRESED